MQTEILSPKEILKEKRKTEISTTFRNLLGNGRAWWNFSKGMSAFIKSNVELAYYTEEALTNILKEITIKEASAYTIERLSNDMQINVKGITTEEKRLYLLALQAATGGVSAGYITYLLHIAGFDELYAYEYKEMKDSVDIVNYEEVEYGLFEYSQDANTQYGRSIGILANGKLQITTSEGALSIIPGQEDIQDNSDLNNNIKTIEHEILEYPTTEKEYNNIFYIAGANKHEVRLERKYIPLIEKLLLTIKPAHTGFITLISGI